MTQTQRAALALMEKRNAGAIRTKIGWVWRNDVRLSQEAAEEVISKIIQDEIPNEEDRS